MDDNNSSGVEINISDSDVSNVSDSSDNEELEAEHAVMLRSRNITNGDSDSSDQNEEENRLTRRRHLRIRPERYLNNIERYRLFSYNNNFTSPSFADEFGEIQHVLRAAGIEPTANNTQNEISDGIYNTELPTEHSYLGTLERVSGIELLEAGKTYRIPVMLHNLLVFPGETIPMIMSEEMFIRTNIRIDGLLYGLVFADSLKGSKLYGVTCQIFEKGSNIRGNIVIKSHAQQRFVISKENNAEFFDQYQTHDRLFANVKILPEIILPDPLHGINITSLNKFKSNKSMDKKIRKYEAFLSYWPTFVYDQYDVNLIIEKIKKYLATLKLVQEIPMDPVAFSFWCAQNILLNSTDRMDIFINNSSTHRIILIGQVLDKSSYYACRNCKKKIATFKALFAMSKHGIQSNYCNPSGVIHETHTFYNVKSESVYLSERASTEFSWFPGYAWQIAFCSGCDKHLGWKFSATRYRNVAPHWFYGLSASSIMQFPLRQKNVSTNDDD